MNWSRVMLVSVALILPGCEMIDPAMLFSRLRQGERARIVREPAMPRQAAPIVQASYRPAERPSMREASLRPSAPVARRAPVTAYAGEPNRAAVDRAFRELDELLSPNAPSIARRPALRGAVPNAPAAGRADADPLLANRYDPRNDPNRASLLPSIPPVRVIDIDAVLDGLRGSSAIY